MSKANRLFDLKARESQLSIANRWGGKKVLVKSWAPISRFFLEHYTELNENPGEPGINSSQAMLLIHLIDFKWGEDHPYPKLDTLADRMGMSARAVRDHLVELEKRNLLQRNYRPGSSTEYDLTGLFDRLEKILEQKAGLEGGE